MTAEYSPAVQQLMAMTDEVVPASAIAPILQMHPSVITNQAKTGRWDRNVCNYIISGNRVKHSRIGFIKFWDGDET